jgi:hypothetical protein
LHQLLDFSDGGSTSGARHFVCSASHEFITGDLFGGLGLAFAVWIVASTGDSHRLFGGRRDIVETLLEFVDTMTKLCRPQLSLIPNTNTSRLG